MIQRKFITGDEWLFYKLYTGPKTADKIVSEVIYPAVHKLIVNQIVDKWFFLRYSDPKFHIRFRVHIPEPKHIGSIIYMLNNALKPSFQNQLIWKVQTDTYNREIERYGSDTMNSAESLFYHDSEMIASFLGLLDEGQGEFYRWMFSVKAVDQLLSDFNYQLFEKHQLLELLKNGFGREFGMNKPLKLQLDKKFRQERSHINRLMKGDNEFKPIYKIINEKSERIESIVAQIFSLNVKNELERPLNDLMSSYIHMMCNRLFKSKQRLHELVVYDFMERFYKSEIAKLKYQNTESPKQRVNS